MKETPFFLPSLFLPEKGPYPRAKIVLALFRHWELLLSLHL
jgi:hypothetical protein